MVSLKWTLPAAGLALALAMPSAFANERDLTSMCGPNMDVTAQRMQAGALNGTQATECWCFFWESAGSKPIRMFNGKQAADVCARYIAPRS